MNLRSNLPFKLPDRHLADINIVECDHLLTAEKHRAENLEYKSHLVKIKLYYNNKN